MPYIPQAQGDSGLYIATTTVYDQINSANFSDELKQILVVLYQNTNNIALALNQKESGIYDLHEFVNGQGWFVPPPGTPANMQLRPDYTKVLWITSFPPGTMTVAHGIDITGQYTFTSITGVANDTVGFNYYPIGASGTGVDISVTANVNNVVLTNNTGITFNATYVVLKFLKT